MYRIELAPGEETALRTMEELTIGIRNGVVTPRARIWHNAGQKWLPIEFHPHYRAALDQLEAAPVPPAEQSVELPGELPISDGLGGGGRRPSDDAGSPSDGARASVRRPLGLLAIGLVLVVGTQMALSVTPFGWLSATATATSQVSALAATAASSAASSENLGEPAAVVAAPAAIEAPKAIAGGAVVLGPVQAAKRSIAPPVVESLPAAPVLPQPAADVSSTDLGADSLPPIPVPNDSNPATTADSSEPSRP